MTRIDTPEKMRLIERLHNFIEYWNNRLDVRCGKSHKYFSHIFLAVGKEQGHTRIEITFQKGVLLRNFSEFRSTAMPDEFREFGKPFL